MKQTKRKKILGKEELRVYINMRGSDCTVLCIHVLSCIHQFPESLMRILSQFAGISFQKEAEKFKLKRCDGLANVSLL